MSPPAEELILPLRKVSVPDTLASDIPTEGTLQNRFQAALPSIARRRIGGGPRADSPAGADEQKAFQPKLSRTSALLLGPAAAVVGQPPRPAQPPQEEAVLQRPPDPDLGPQPGLRRQPAAHLRERGGDVVAPLEEPQPGLSRAGTRHSCSDPWWPRNFQHCSRDSDDQVHQSDEEESDPGPEAQPRLSRASFAAQGASGGNGPEAGAGPAFDDVPDTPDEPDCSPTRSSGSRPPRTASGYLRRGPASGPQGSVLARLRDSFATGMGARSGRVSRTQLFCHVKSLAEARCGPLSVDLLELLCEVIKRSYAEVALGLEETNQGGFGVDEWVHHLMLRSSAPGHTASVGLNRRLSRALREDPGLLHRLHAAFEAAEAESGGGDGRLSFDRAKAALRSVGARELVAPLDPDEQSAMDYYHFVSHALGAEACEVELALYDLSQGAARWVPPALLGGHRFDGIWHSGVRVFGKEFWYGGVILESRFEENPFGKPAQVISLGKTLRTREEVLEFLRNDLYADFNPRTYDVLRRNCNHFSNELVQLLLHGRQIPEEVRMQPEWARNARLVRALRPLLNRWLGGFGSDDPAGAMSPSSSPSSPACPPHVVSRIDDLTEEWRSRLQEGDIVLHRARFIDRPSVVRILRFGSPAQGGGGPRQAAIASFRPAASRRDDGVAELAAFWDWEVAEQEGVPLRELYPLLSQGEAGAQILRAGLTLTDSRLGDILQRPPSTCVRPVCARGHRLQPEVASWFRQAPPCSVCAAKLAAADQRMCCARCSFLVCTACVDRGLSMPGGGVFADMLSRELAEALLADKGWLAFRARAYFYKADHNGTGSVDRAKARRLSSRLGAELGVQQGAETDLVRQIWWQGNGSEAVELDEEAFVSFFGGALSRALARQPPTPQSAHCGGAAVLPTALVARQCKDTAAAL